MAHLSLDKDFLLLARPSCRLPLLLGGWRPDCLFLLSVVFVHVCFFCRRLRLWFGRAGDAVPLLFLLFLTRSFRSLRSLSLGGWPPAASGRSLRSVTSPEFLCLGPAASSCTAAAASSP